MTARDRLITVGCRLLGIPFALSRRRRAVPDLGSILILKPCCIGDVLMATAAAAAVRERWPRARLVFGTGPWSLPVLANNPHLDELWDIGSVGIRGRTSLSEYATLVRRARRGRFDACLVLDRSPLMTMLPFLARIPIRAGLNSAGRGFALTHRVACPPNRHEAELYLDVARRLGATPSAPRLHFVPSADDAAWTEAKLGGTGLPLIALHPGGGDNPGTTLVVKRWPALRFADVAWRAIEAGYGIVLVGAPSDRPAVAAVRATIGYAPACRRLDSASVAGALIDLAEQPTLGQLGAVIARCRLFIGNDSGPLHLATAVGTPAIGIFGPSSPQSYGPFDDRSVAVYKGAECSPCFVGGQAPFPGRSDCDHRCMTAIAADEVWSIAEGLLALSHEAESPRP